MIEKKVNEYGQEQIIENFDKIIKIGNCLLQVRLIKTKKFKDRFEENGEFTKPMPRAKFVRKENNPYYLVRKSDIIKMKGGRK